MKILMTLGLAAALVALPTQTHAWVAAGHTRRITDMPVISSACWHVGYSCGGVSTGTAVAAGMAGLAAGAMIGSAVARANTPADVVAPTPVYAAPYYVAPPPVVVAPSGADRQHLLQPATGRAIGEHQWRPVLCSGRHLLPAFLRQQRRLLPGRAQPDLRTVTVRRR